MSNWTPEDAHDYAARVENWRRWDKSQAAKGPIDAQAKQDAKNGVGTEWASLKGTKK